MDKKDNRYYGEFGGQYVSESLMNTLDELEKAFDEAIKDPEFINSIIIISKSMLEEKHLFIMQSVSAKNMARKFI